MGQVPELVAGTHACCRFDGRAHKRAVVADFVRAGLDRGERVAVYLDDDDPTARLTDWLPEQRVGELVDSGQLVPGSARAAYLDESGLDADSRTQGFADLADRAVDEGYTGMRVFADNGAIPAQLAQPLDWLDYELRVSLMIEKRPLIGLCGFDEGPSPLSTGAVAAAHPTTVGDRRSSFWLDAHDDGLALHGELDTFAVEDARTLFEGGREVLRGRPLSLAELAFVDVAAAHLLAAIVADVQPVVRDVPPMLERIWDLLGISVAQA